MIHSKKRFIPVLLIFVPGSGIFLRNYALEAVEASEVAETAEENDVEEVSKAWKITTVDF